MILFLLKKRSQYGSYGLINSCRFIVHALKEHGIKAEHETVTDANEIDKVVTELRPSIVIIEALWVTPVKLEELVKLHSKVKWIVRIHSHTPFLASEGIAF